MSEAPERARSRHSGDAAKLAIPVFGYPQDKRERRTVPGLTRNC
jgi:hypothetical protein